MTQMLCISHLTSFCEITLQCVQLCAFAWQLNMDLSLCDIDSHTMLVRKSQGSY